MVDTIYVQHGFVRVFPRYRGSYYLGVLLRRGRYGSIKELICCDSDAQRDEYLDRIRKFADLLD